jgi:neutral ceramidase
MSARQIGFWISVIMGISPVWGDEFLAGAGSRSIMPTREMVDNSIHGNMTVRFDEVGSPLKAQALALSFEAKSVMLIALDLAVVPDAHAKAIRSLIAEPIGLKPEQIIVSASHSHSTPFFEPMDGPHPFFEFVCKQSNEAAEEAWSARRPARYGYDTIYLVGASFNTQVPMPNGGVKFTRDFREGLATGRPIDPRLTILRIDDEGGRPIAGWIRFATHPACVIFNAPISGEYPSYMTERLREGAAQGAPVLFGFGAAGDSNCIPMFGRDEDSERLGLQMAALAAPAFEKIQTKKPARMLLGCGTVELPLDPPPSMEVLDREIAEVEQFIREAPNNPDLEWAMGINCKKDWPVQNKINHYKPLAEWARRVKKALLEGNTFPTTWPSEITVLILDDLGMVFYPGEPLTGVGLALPVRSPLKETLLIALSNGANGYLGTAEDRRRGGYETFSSVRYSLLKEGDRPMPYAPAAADCLIEKSVSLIQILCENP